MQHAARLPLAAPAAASPSGRGRPPRCSAAVPAQGGTQRRVAGAGGRAASLVAHAGGGEEPNPVFGFLKAVQGGLPVIGLVRARRSARGAVLGLARLPRRADAAVGFLQLSRLTTPENGFDGNKLSYSEYCRAQYDRAGNDFGTAATELARNRGSVRAPRPARACAAAGGPRLTRPRPRASPRAPCSSSAGWSRRALASWQTTRRAPPAARASAQQQPRRGAR